MAPQYRENNSAELLRVSQMAIVLLEPGLAVNLFSTIAITNALAACDEQ